MSSDWIDVTLNISSDGVVWPGAPKTELEWRRSMPKGDRSNNSNLSMNCHTGTHIDAPLHFVDGGESIENLDLGKMIGPAFLIDLSDKEAIELKDLQERWPEEKVKRLIIKTKNSEIWKKNQTNFVEDFVALRETETRWLLDQGIELVGIDYLSIQCFGDSPIVHQLLLEAKVVVIEGLDLRPTKQGFHDLICLPIKIKGGEGAPSRVVLRPKN